MSQITSPPEIVKRAEADALLACTFVLSDRAFGSVSADTETMAEGAAAELRERFPHLDNASLVLICSYISGLGVGLGGTIGRAVSRGFDYLTVLIANDLLDDIEADEALSALRAKLTGEAEEPRADWERDLLAGKIASCQPGEAEGQELVDSPFPEVHGEGVA